MLCKRISVKCQGCRVLQARRQASVHVVAQGAANTNFMPALLDEIGEPAAQSMARAMRRIPVTVPKLNTVDTAVVGPRHPSVKAPTSTGLPPVVMLHGFDSSGMEFRRLHPLVSEYTDAYTVDLAGWGFTDCGFSRNPTQMVGPEEKRNHLYAFWQQEIKTPMVLLGVSLGGAAALDFAIAHPEAVDRLVLVDPQVFVDGIGPMASLPRPLASLGVSLLKTAWLRDAANQMAYHNKQRCSTLDARKVGQLHTLLPGWQDAIVSFMRSGGYRVASQLAQVGQIEQDVLVLWGRQDEILPPENAAKVIASLPHARLQWLEECGHTGHLEQPEQVAAAVRAFLEEGREAGAKAAAPATASV